MVRYRNVHKKPLTIPYRIVRYLETVAAFVSTASPVYNCVQCQLISITVGSGANIAGSRVAVAVVASAAAAAVDVTAVTTAAADRFTASKFLLTFSCINGFV
jgi:hypothetical protein